MNFCINCKYIGTNASGDWEKYRCFAPENKGDINLVTGTQEYKIVFCKDIRYLSPESRAIDCAVFEVKPLDTKPAPHSLVPVSPALAKLKKSIGLDDL